MKSRAVTNRQINLACDQLAAQARQFCKLVDSRGPADADQFLQRVLFILPELIGAAAKLPDVSLRGENPPESAVSHEQWKALYSSLSKMLGDKDAYWRVLNPSKPEQPVAGSLANDIADIYCDLKCGLVALQKGIQKRAVIWQWRCDFSHHWGAHATDALRALYQLHFA